MQGAERVVTIPEPLGSSHSFLSQELPGREHTLMWQGSKMGNGGFIQSSSS